MKVQRLPEESVLVLVGEFNQAGAGECEAPLEQLLSEGGATKDPVVLDFSQVTYMDSAGFSRWVALERKTQQRGRDLRVRGASPLIRDLFSFADLEEVLEP